MVLWYLKSKDPIYKLCPVFGVVPSTASVWLDYGVEVMSKVIEGNECKYFAVKWPDEDQMRHSASILEQNRNHDGLLNGVFAVMDGGRMLCSRNGDPNIQNAYWEGFSQSREVTNLFVWDFKGELIFAAVNYPGSWLDSRVAAASGL